MVNKEFSTTAGRTGRWQARLLAVAIALVVVIAVSVGAVGGFVGAMSFTRPALAQGVTPATPETQTVSLNPSAALQAAVIDASSKVSAAVVSIRTEDGLGSGVIYDASGLVLTNNHVVDGATQITVGLSDGRHFSGKVLGTDTGFDLAVVKIEGQDLPTAPLGDSAKLQVGEFVIAIGNPYGFDHTVTTGVISGMNRPISEGQGSYSQAMLQTDAAINPGNSGGPLVDLQGNVVGLNTLIAAPQGIPAQGLGFAIPVNTIKRIAPQLVQDGQVTNSGQPYLGASFGDLPTAGQTTSRSRFGARTIQRPTGVDHGAWLGQVGANGPAAKAGLQAGDVITHFDGRDIYNADELLQSLVLHEPGDQVDVTLVRNGQTQTVTLTIGEAPVTQ